MLIRNLTLGILAGAGIASAVLLAIRPGSGGDASRTPDDSSSTDTSAVVSAADAVTAGGTPDAIAAAGPAAAPNVVAAAAAASSPYVVIGWNDLGMHCLSSRFAEMAILPPYNNLQVVVIRRGEEPQIMTSGIVVKYAMLNNTKVTGKTDFWTFAPKLFGKTLPVGTGLTGSKLSGTMKLAGDHFEATGVPVLPYNDDGTWNPYQQAVITVTDTKGNQIGTTQFVVPISDEMNCQKCHATGGVAAKGIATPTVEGNILTLHDKNHKTTLMKQRPVLCGSCHADAALGTAGKTGVKSLSYAMHDKHSAVAAQPDCADCHPGAKTQCNRSAISGMGPKSATDPNCATCHGNLKAMASGLKAGRKPWVQEPTCVQCHAGTVYNTGAVLYRNSKGHGGVPCVTCHNSPHAWWPSKRDDDNAQPMKLQGNNHALGYNACFVCHNDGRRGTVPPHGGEGGGGSSED